MNAEEEINEGYRAWEEYSWCHQTRNTTKPPCIVLCFGFLDTHHWGFVFGRDAAIPLQDVDKMFTVWYSIGPCINVEPIGT